MSDREQLVVTRVYDASPERIWEAFTTPEQLAQFFAPAGSRVPPETLEMDVRVGGVFKLEMHNTANGEIYPMNAEYTALDAPHRLAFSTAGGIDAAIELEDLGQGKTLLTWTTEVDFAGDEEFRRGATIGTHSTVDQLGELLRA